MTNDATVRIPQFRICQRTPPRQPYFKNQEPTPGAWMPVGGSYSTDFKATQELCERHQKARPKCGYRIEVKFPYIGLNGHMWIEWHPGLEAPLPITDCWYAFFKGDEWQGCIAGQDWGQGSLKYPPELHYKGALYQRGKYEYFRCYIRYERPQ